MSGIEDEYFQHPSRRDLILDVLYIWAATHKTTSYRQGMHEIVAPILFVLEMELEGFDQFAVKYPGCDNPLAGVFSRRNLEAYTYWILMKIMDQLEPLYDPTVRTDGQPQVVHFCANLQENLLRQLDPALCEHLEENFVQSQIYGMRWSRLLLGREFECSDTQTLRIWDYIFASCASPNSDLDNVLDSPPAAADVIKSRSRYSVTSPLLLAVGHFMLAMLLHIRQDIVEGDGNTTLSLLMHYPQFPDITPILDLADMIRRGVLFAGAHVGAIIGDDFAPISRPSEMSGQKTPPPTKAPSWLGSASSTVTSLTSSATSAMLSVVSVTSSSKSKIPSSDAENSFSSTTAATDTEHLDPFGITSSIVSSPQPKKSSLGLSSSIFGSSSKKLGTSSSEPFVKEDINTPDLFHSDRKSSLLSEMTSRPSEFISFNPTKLFCSNVADRIDALSKQLLEELPSSSNLESSSNSQMVSEKLKTLAEVLRGHSTLSKYDETI